MSWCIVAFVVFSTFVCFARPSQNSQDSFSDPQLASIAPTGPPEAGISVTRLRAPGKARAHYNQAFKLFVKNKFSDAEREVEVALRLYPAYPDALTLRGAIQLYLHHFESAERDFQAAIRSDTRYSPAYVSLADLYNSESRFDDALALTEQAATSMPATWNVQYEIARALIGKRQYESALAIADSALHAKRPHHLLHLAKARALLGLKQYSQAKIELQTYLADERPGDREHARGLLNQIQNVSGQ